MPFLEPELKVIIALVGTLVFLGGWKVVDILMWLSKHINISWQ